MYVSCVLLFSAIFYSISATETWRDSGPDNPQVNRPYQQQQQQVYFQRDANRNSRKVDEYPEKQIADTLRRIKPAHEEQRSARRSSRKHRRRSRHRYTRRRRKFSPLIDIRVPKEEELKVLRVPEERPREPLPAVHKPNTFPPNKPLWSSLPTEVAPQLTDQDIVPFYDFGMKISNSEQSQNLKPREHEELLSTKTTYNFPKNNIPQVLRGESQQADLYPQSKLPQTIHSRNQAGPLERDLSRTEPTYNFAKEEVPQLLQDRNNPSLQLPRTETADESEVLRSFANKNQEVPNKNKVKLLQSTLPTSETTYNIAKSKIPESLPSRNQNVPFQSVFSSTKTPYNLEKSKIPQALRQRNQRVPHRPRPQTFRPHQSSKLISILPYENITPVNVEFNTKASTLLPPSRLQSSNTKYTLTKPPQVKEVPKLQAVTTAASLSTTTPQLRRKIQLESLRALFDRRIAPQPRKKPMTTVPITTVKGKTNPPEKEIFQKFSTKISEVTALPPTSTTQKPERSPLLSNTETSSIFPSLLTHPTRASSTLVTVPASSEQRVFRARVRRPELKSRRKPSPEYNPVFNRFYGKSNEHAKSTRPLRRLFRTKSTTAKPSTTTKRKQRVTERPGARIFHSVARFRVGAPTPVTSNATIQFRTTSKPKVTYSAETKSVSNSISMQTVAQRVKEAITYRPTIASRRKTSKSRYTNEDPQRPQESSLRDTSIYPPVTTGIIYGKTPKPYLVTRPSLKTETFPSSTNSLVTSSTKSILQMMQTTESSDKTTENPDKQLGSSTPENKNISDDHVTTTLPNYLEDILTTTRENLQLEDYPKVFSNFPFGEDSTIRNFDHFYVESKMKEITEPSQHSQHLPDKFTPSSSKQTTQSSVDEDDSADQIEVITSTTTKATIRKEQAIITDGDSYVRIHSRPKFLQYDSTVHQYQPSEEYVVLDSKDPGVIDATTRTYSTTISEEDREKEDEELVTSTLASDQDDIPDRPTNKTTQVADVDGLKIIVASTSYPGQYDVDRLASDRSRENIKIKPSTGHPPTLKTSTSNITVIAVVAILPCAAAIAWGIRWLIKRRKEYDFQSLVRDFGLEKAPLGRTSSRSNIKEPAGFYTFPIHLPGSSWINSSTTDKDDDNIEDSFESSNSPWEYDRNKLKLNSVLGEGNFGQVWKAEAQNICGCDGIILVAVKTVKETASHKEKLELLRELELMQKLGPHPHVVTLLGCCTRSEPFFLILEYVMFGKLLTYLRDSRLRHTYHNFNAEKEKLSCKDLTTFAFQVATGMEYISSKGIIHRDLAARNILVGLNKVCKIADFGLSRDVNNSDGEMYEQRTRGALPIRWMAPECLYLSIFTHKSDVWSFGVLLWEIVTLGSTPYPGMSAREVMRRVREGYRLEKPPHCRTELYDVMNRCWNSDGNKRPDFHLVRQQLGRLLDHHTGYIDLENFPKDTYFHVSNVSGEKV